MFKIGDVVQMKGGSPVMTVIGIRKDPHGNDELTVVWFDDTDKAQTADYPPGGAEGLRGRSARRNSRRGPLTQAGQFNLLATARPVFRVRWVPWCSLA
jgi:uncharacterized protein YodC (DUF2158 family)